ncbi:MAG: hypothetical protein ACFE0S_11945 [Rhodospirillales bacterium]
MLGRFKKNKPAPAYEGPAIDLDWARNKRGKFHRLTMLDTMAERLNGLSGVYVIWHSGVKPQWVYVGASNNLGHAIDRAAEDDDIASYEVNGGLYVTWSPILKERQGGVLKFLHDAMRPAVENPAVKSIQDGPINVVVPKRKTG